MRRIIVPAAALAAALAAAGPAAAQDTTPTTVGVPVPPVTTTTTTTAPAPPPAPEPASGTIKLTIQRTHRGSVFSGAHWRVRGVLDPYVPGQTVTVRLYHGHHRLKSKTVHVTPSTGTTGVFAASFHIKRTGPITVKATHAATDELDKIVARSKSVLVLPTHLAPGARGASVRVLQRDLRRMHFAVGPTGRYDQRTGRAVLAYQKLLGLPRTSVADRRTMRKLVSGAGHFRIRYPRQGKHVEASLSKQLIALINRHGKVYRLYPVSSGKPSTPTILGNFHVYEKSPGYNSEGMYFSSYFIRGYAIHGYDPSPNYAASHGCLRTWIPDAISIYNWLRVGDPVDVYR